MSFNWFQLIPEVGHENAHVATLAAAGAGLTIVSLVANAKLGKGEEALTPSGKFSIKGIFEVVTEFIQGLVDMVIGEHGRVYIPMFATIFTFVLVNNLIGILPGMTPATENINTTLALGIFTFLTYNFLGIKENGIHYLAHFWGPIFWLGPMMLIIELISHFVRPISLGLRLANVLMGDHTVVSIFLGLVPVGLPIPFYLLGIFVCFVQAFVFTLLSMVYVALATAHDH